MPRKKKDVVEEVVETVETVETEEVVETVETEEAVETIEDVVLTEEEQLVTDALASSNVTEALEIIVEEENAIVSDLLRTIVATYFALSAALGDEAPATIKAHENIEHFKSAKAKKAKKAKKAPKYNENKALKEAFEIEDEAERDTALEALRDDERITEDLKTLIVTFFTLKAIDDLPEAIIDNAKAALVANGKKRKSGGGGPRPQLKVRVNDDVYVSLCAALTGNGLLKTTVVPGEEGKKDRNAQDIAWAVIRPKLKEVGDSVEYQDVTYIFTDDEPTIESVRKKKVETPVESTDEATDESTEVE